jgi:ribosome biogenesis GTPase A
MGNVHSHDDSHWKRIEELEDKLREQEERRERQREKQEEQQQREKEYRATQRAYEKEQKRMAAELERMAKEKRLEDEKKREQEEYERQLREYPIPEWLDPHKHGVNVGLVGASGAGKSSLNNKIRGLMRRNQCQPGEWAETGVTETTIAPKGFDIKNMRDLKIWDLPGVGTPRFPAETYFRDVGLR